MKTAKLILEEQIRISEERLKIFHYPTQVEPSVKEKIESCKEVIALIEASQYTTNKVTDKGNELEFALNNYVKEKHTQEECIGFIDGFNKGLSLSTQEKQPEREMSPKFTEADMRNLLSKFNNTQISFSKMVELINEKFYTLPKQITEGKEAEG